jgi:hypothetical protein
MPKSKDFKMSVVTACLNTTNKEMSSDEGQRKEVYYMAGNGMVRGKVSTAVHLRVDKSFRFK